MLVFGVISPHPPIILPEVGGADLPKVQKTINALKQAAASLAAAKPDRLIIISPHQGHGFAVPERYLRDHLPANLPIEEILVTQDSYQHYFTYGQEVGRRLHQDRTRYAVVASGDLSHVLKADGPYGFKADGPLLDELILAAVRQRDPAALLAINTTILDQGAECGLRSILFLLGTLDGLQAHTNILSYEGPFGVGYMVATFEPKTQDKTAQRLIDLARQSIKHYLTTATLIKTPHDLGRVPGVRAGVFVSLYRQGLLRGCIGTIAPTKDSLAQEVIANAVAAATQDPRFAPVSLAELDNLDLGIDILTPAVPEPDISKLDPKKYGIIVVAADGRQGVLLPDLEDIATVQQQIAICRQKAGISPAEPVKIAKFEAKRYEQPA